MQTKSTGHAPGQMQKFPYQMTPDERVAERERRLAYREKLNAWRAAAIADGWSAKPLYTGDTIERTCWLQRDGFTVQLYTRDMQLQKLTDVSPWPEAKIYAWGPDRCSLDHALPDDLVYDMAALHAAMKVCSWCGTSGVDTVRVGFADRCCASCKDAARKVIERPGWDD